MAFSRIANGKSSLVNPVHGPHGKGGRLSELENIFECIPVVTDAVVSTADEGEIK